MKHGALCLILIIAAAAFALIIQVDSEESTADGTVSYDVSGDMIGTYGDLSSAFTAINADGGVSYIITVTGDDLGATAFVVKAGKDVTLTSLSGDVFKIIIKAGGRHGTVNGNLTLENVILDGNGTAGGITVNSSGTLIMNPGSVIQNCYSGGNGGGVYSAGTFNMYGGEITNNSSAAYGGGVYSTSTFNMYGGEITNNSSTVYGGGVYSSGTKAVFNMSGYATISENSATAASSYGGGVANLLGSVFNMSDHAAVSGNRATFYAGGVFNWMNSTFTMTDNSSIYDNAVTTYGDYGGGVTNHTAMFYMSGNAVIHNNEATYGGGVFNIDGTFYMSGNAVVSNNNANARGGGVYNNSYDYETVFSMSGNATICGNTVTAATSYGGGVFNGSKFGNQSIFTMSDNASIHDNTVITNITVDSYGGGVFINSNTIFNMLGGEIYDNSGGNGGGISNSGIFTMSGGAICGNTAGIGGGIYNTGKLNITGGVISDNVATSSGKLGSGGGIYTTNFDNLTIADGVVFYGNSAPTLRTIDIAADADLDGDGVYDQVDYAGRIGNVVFSVPIPFWINAPAYNNYDINYIGDVYVVFVDIDPDGTGTVTVSDTDNGVEYGTFTADGYVYVPITVNSITLAATPISGYEFSRFVINVTSEISDDQTIVSILGNMYVVAEFVNTPVVPPVKPPVKYDITATADNGSTISPSGKLTVVAGGTITFEFSAKHGYVITSVYVDGVEISQKAGIYTFYGVSSNHTIAVISEADSGIGGDIGSGGGTDSGNEGPVNDGGRQEWALLNLICAVIALFAGIIAVIAAWNNRREEDDSVPTNYEEKRSKAFAFFGIAALIIGIVSVIIFFMTENWTMPMVIVDRWTLLMIILLIATIVLAVIGSRSDGKENEGKIGTAA